MKSLKDILESAAINAPGKGLIVSNKNEDDIFIPYADLLVRSKKVSFILTYHYNIKPHNKVVISVDKSEDFILLFWGCIMAGCIPVLMPPAQSGNKKSIAFERLKNAMEILQPAVLITSDISLAEQYQYSDNTTIYSGNVLKQVELLHEFAPGNMEFEENELCVIQFSSGSTGNPKGIMLSFNNILANIKLKTIADEITSEDVLIHWMPYFHDYGLFGNHLVCVYNQITEIKIEPFSYLRDPLLFLRKITQYKVSICGGTTPSGLEILIKKLENNSFENECFDLSRVKTLSVGAEMIPPCLYSNLIPLYQQGLPKTAYRPGYGMAETTLIISACLPGEGGRNIKIDRKLFSEAIIRLAGNEADFCEFVSAGHVLPGLQVRIADDLNHPQDIMTLGEIQVKGPCVMSGYYNAPEATKEVLTDDGWLKTGDLGFFDPEHILYIVGRKKEIIIVNGQNFHPFDLENCMLDKFGTVLEKSVFTSFYSTSENHEVVLHFFVPGNTLSNIQAAHLIKECNAYLADLFGFTPGFSIKIKKGDIPRTSSSKMMRRAMAQNFINGIYNNRIVNNPQKNENMKYHQILQEIWTDVLQTSLAIHPADNFFSLGGDSIRSMVGVSRIEEQLYIKLENSFFYKYPTLASQVEYLEQYFTTEVQTPENEFELLIRELICEELDIPMTQLKFTDNFIRKAASFTVVNQIMQRITTVFDRIIQEDLNERTSVRDIASLVKERYSTPAGTSFPLMDFQETLFYHSKSFIRNEPTGLSCYIICRTRLQGLLDVACWNRVFNHLIACHPLMHSVLSEESDKPEMITLARYPDFKCSYEDITSMSKPQQEAFLKEKDIEDHDYRFDLKKYPLFYCHIYKTGENEHELTFHIDHQIIDGFSFFRFIQELTSTYDLLLSGKKPVIEPEKGLLFSDYTFVEKFRRQTKRYQNAMEFALNVFKNLPEKISIPTKQQPSLIEKVHFSTFHTELDSGLMTKVLDIAHNTQGICLNSLLMACYFKLMNLWSGQNDLIINMPVLNREQHLPNARNVSGSFLDIFPVRIQTTPQEPVVSVARKIEKFVRVMLEYPVSSIELSRKIAEQDGLKQGSLSAIIFSNSINMLPPGISQSSRNIFFGAPRVQTGAPGTYIDLVMYTWEEKWCFDWNYVRELFEPEFIQQLSEQYTTILNQLVTTEDPLEYSERPCSGILSSSYKQLLQEVNKTQHVYPVKTIHEQVKEMVIQYPDREAVSFGCTSLTYREFWLKANQMAHFLRKLGVTQHSKVVLLLNRTLDLPVVQLGILLAGGVYVPIDPSYPSDRIKYMIDDCGADVLISQGIHAGNINKSHTAKIKSCVLLEQENAGIPETYNRYTKKDIENCSPEEIPVCNTPDDLIYIIYTSGSTGQPKGTMLRHRNVSNFLYYEKDAFNVNSENRFALVTSYSFDMTVTSNWLPFVTGASLHILSDSETRDVEALLHFIDDKKINFLNVTPSHFSMLVNTLGFLEKPVHFPDEMTIMLGAEIINVPDINRWLDSYPKHKFINEYGPTETTVASTFYPIPVENGKCRLNTVPIGKPIYNTQVYVLNDGLKPALPGVPGILYIGGDGVSCGYLNKEEKTRSVFIPNPITHDSNDIIYNTGDLVKMTETGDIVFVGRKDFQVNVRGYRIELGEIENALPCVPDITEACADIQYDANKQPVVVAFYVSSDNRDIDNKDIMEVIQTKIPHFMLPSSMMRIPQIPVSANGKTDKKQLPHIADQKQNLIKRNVAAPGNEKEKQMVLAWRHILGIPDISIHDNFWEIGGDSIRSVRLIRELKDHGFKTIKLKDLFDKPTIAELAELEYKEDNGMENLICMKKTNNPGARLVCLPYAAGTPGMYTTFAGHFTDIDIYTAQYPGHGDGREIKSTIEEVGSLLVNELKKLDRDIPLFLMGYSYSCYIAYDICKQLEQENIAVQGILMIGGTPPTLLDDLMQFFSNDDSALLDYSRAKDILNEELISTFSEEETHEYLHELRLNTVAMVKYKFSNSKLRTPLCSIVGKEDEPAITKKQQLWSNYFNEVRYFQLPGGHVLINKYHAELAKTVIHFIKAASHV